MNMAVKKKVSPSIESFIDKGADVRGSRDRRFKNVLIRMPIELLDEIDSGKNKPWLNRTQWIVEAIHDKLRKE